MKKSTIGLIVILLMIIAIAIFAFVGNKKENNTNTTNATPTNEEENILQNEQANEVNNEANEIISNEMENQVKNETVEKNEVSTETFEESPKTAKEKAVDIVKKDWGTTSNVEFSVEGMDANGNYIVTIRDGKSTQALAFYTVNVDNGTFSKKEMN